MNKVILFNPRAASRYRIPNSILQVGAAIEGKYEYVFVDGNREKDPWSVIEKLLQSGEYRYFGTTVMPGPQLTQAIPFAKRVRENFPEVINIWGGYFASNQHQSVLHSGWVDYVINGPGDKAFPALLDALEKGESPDLIRNLIFLRGDEIVTTTKDTLLDQDALPPYPYEKLDSFYSMDGYLAKTYLGNKTIGYHSSFGCPFTCSFCAVVPIYNARWKGKSAELIYKDIKYLKEKHGADAVEFHDNNFFVSEKRVVQFAELMRNEGMNWWGEARIDTMDKYKDESLALIRESGCKMIFFGAESGNDEILKSMDKGGKQTAEQIKSFAARLRKFDIVPEYSFVLGTPADSPEQVMRQIEAEIDFIKLVKETNPDTEIIIYLYSPVPQEGTELYQKVLDSGFRFPENLEDWLDPAWEKFDLRKNPLTPWLTAEMVDRIQDFETVLNAYYPTRSDIKITPFQRKSMRLISSWRYRSNTFKMPYELKALQKFWLHYRQPEIEGF